MQTETVFKRPKTIPSKTEHIETSCGTLHLTLGYHEDKLIEVRAMIGKNGTCGNVMLDTIAKLMSITLQSGLAKYKICEKMKKQFCEMNCGQDKFKWEEKEYTGCVDYIVKKVIEELS